MLKLQFKVAQLDMHPADDQEVAGFIFAGSCSVLSWRWSYNIFESDHKIFSTVILSFLLIQERQLSVSGERMCTNTG